MRGYRGSTVGGGNVVKPLLTLRLEDAKTQGFSSYSYTHHFNYFFGDKEILARQVGFLRYRTKRGAANEELYNKITRAIHKLQVVSLRDCSRCKNWLKQVH